MFLLNFKLKQFFLEDKLYDLDDSVNFTLLFLTDLPATTVFTKHYMIGNILYLHQGLRHC